MEKNSRNLAQRKPNKRIYSKRFDFNLIRLVNVIRRHLERISYASTQWTLGQHGPVYGLYSARTQLEAIWRTVGVSGDALSDRHRSLLMKYRTKCSQTGWCRSRTRWVCQRQPGGIYWWWTDKWWWQWDSEWQLASWSVGHCSICWKASCIILRRPGTGECWIRSEGLISDTSARLSELVPEVSSKRWHWCYWQGWHCR